jgi:hypothetical protein
VALNATEPEKPFVLVRVMEVAPDEPWATVRDVGLDAIAKSGEEDVGLWMTKLPTIEPGWTVQ